jgi:Flp pilus assembly pilin Flp
MLRSLVQATLAALRDRRGATAVEYGLLIGGVALAILAAIFAIGDEVVDFFEAAKGFSQAPG